MSLHESLALSTVPRVLFVCSSPFDTAICRYRCEHLAAVLTAAYDGGPKPEVAYAGQCRIRVAHDVVVLHRVEEGHRFARAARRCGAALIYAADDLVFDAEAAERMAAVWEAANPGALSRLRLRRLRQHAPLHREMIATADACLASTEFLAERMRAVAPAGVPVVTLRNFLSAEQLTLSDAAWQDRGASRARVTLGYLAGTATHDADLGSVAEPLRRVLEEQPEADLLLVGPVRTPAILADLEAAGRVRHLPFVHWRDLPRLLAREVDVNLAPLDLSHPFNHAKSEIKFLEAAAVRVPTVAAASAAMREALGGGGAEVGGFLAETPEEWRRLLRNLIGDAALRRHAGEAAYHTLAAAGTAATHRASVVAAFARFARLRSSDEPPRQDRRAATLVNWPLPPAKYALKAALERIEGRSAAPADGTK